VDLAMRHRLPVIMPFPFFADDGGLIAYGTDLIELYRQGGVMVGRILKGASPKSLPVERPNRFLLVVNIKTPKPPCLPIPPSLHPGPRQPRHRLPWVSCGGPGLRSSII